MSTTRCNVSSVATVLNVVLTGSELWGNTCVCCSQVYSVGRPPAVNRLCLGIPRGEVRGGPAWKLRQHFSLSEAFKLNVECVEYIYKNTQEGLR